MRKFNVLLLGGAKRVSFAEHLKMAAESRACTLNLFSYELQKEVPIAVIGEVIIGLRWKDPNIHNHLCEFIRSNNIQMVLPFVDPAISVASELKKRVPDVYIPCSSREICDIMFDKLHSAQWFESQGCAVPRAWHPGQPHFFPLIAKPRHGSASKGLAVVRNLDEFAVFIQTHAVDSYVWQQYIENGEEFTVDAFVAQDGRIISVVPRIRLEQAGGESIRSITLHDKIIEETSVRILQTCVFSGPVTLQFIRNRESDETFLMEINPRYGGAVITSFEAGADTTMCLVAEWEKQPVEVITGWKEKILMTRYFKEVIFHADNS